MSKNTVRNYRNKEIWLCEIEKLVKILGNKKKKIRIEAMC